MKITRTDPFTGKTNTHDLAVTQAQVTAWQRGSLAQDAFPALNADEREFIMSGINIGEFDDLFSISSIDV